MNTKLNKLMSEFENEMMSCEYKKDMKEFFGIENPHTESEWFVHLDDASNHPLMVAMYCYINQYHFCNFEEVVAEINGRMWEDDRENCCWIPKEIDDEVIDKILPVWEEWGEPSSICEVDEIMGFYY